MIRKRAFHDDRGYTLAEMLVVIVVFALVAGSITTVVITTLKHQNTLAQRSTILAQTRAALERVDRDIRGANPLCYASGTHLAMYQEYPTSQINDYAISGTSLVFTQYTPTATANAGPSCVLGTGASATTVYEGASVTSQKVLSNLTTLSPFTIPSVTTFDTCPSSGTTPNATTTAAASTISALTVAVKVLPPNFHHTAVAASDCGNRLRNFIPTS